MLRKRDKISIVDKVHNRHARREGGDSEAGKVQLVWRCNAFLLNFN